MQLTHSFFYEKQTIHHVLCSLILTTSVADPGPDPPDPHVFGPPDPDPDPLVRGMDPDPDPAPDRDPSIIMQK